MELENVNLAKLDIMLKVDFVSQINLNVYHTLGMEIMKYAALVSLLILISLLIHSFVNLESQVVSISMENVSLVPILSKKPLMEHALSMDVPNTA